MEKIDTGSTWYRVFAAERPAVIVRDRLLGPNPTASSRWAFSSPAMAVTEALPGLIACSMSPMKPSGLTLVGVAYS